MNLDAFPSRFTATPEQVDAFLHEVLAEDTLLRFYQWIGKHAMGELFAELKGTAGNVSLLGSEQDAKVLAMVVEIWGDDKFPGKLPVGAHFCDVPWHTHTTGERSPSCRCDCEEERS